ncbi:MAG: hypothetical protein ACQEVA_01090 [Myxococcota bacterium]
MLDDAVGNLVDDSLPAVGVRGPDIDLGPKLSESNIGGRLGQIRAADATCHFGRDAPVQVLRHDSYSCV